MDTWRLEIARIKSDFTFTGSYWEAYNQAVKEARRYGSEVFVSRIGGTWGSAMHFSVSPSAVSAL